MRCRDIRQQRREAEAQKYIGFTPVDDDDEPSGQPWDTEDEQEGEDE